MFLPTSDSNLCVNLQLFSHFQLPCSRSRTNLASPTNEGNAGPIHIGNSADTAAPRATGVNRGQSLTVNANGVRDKRTTRTLSPVAAVTLSSDALVAQPTTVAASEAESAHEEEVDGKTAAVLIVPSEAPQDKRRKKRRGRDDATNSISEAAADAEPIFSKDTVV